MSNERLAGHGILVTRPAHQADELVAAIERLGGKAIRFPTIVILPRDTAEVSSELASQPAADIVIFISSNAVSYGFRPETVAGARIAAVGPATCAAIEQAGGTVDIVSSTGYDSEHLLRVAALQDVSGTNIRIVRGCGGRELLADTLRQRGAKVHCLAVYERRTPRYTKAELGELIARWRAGDVTQVVIMSVESLTNLMAILTADGHELLRKTPLVTPSKRVIKTASGLLPGISTTLGAGPQNHDMIRALSARPAQDLNNER